MQQSMVKFYCFVVETLLNMFRELSRPSSGARQTAVEASGFRVNVKVDVFSAVVGLLVTNKPSNCRCSLWFPCECEGGRVLSRGRFVSD